MSSLTRSPGSAVLVSLPLNCDKPNLESLNHCLPTTVTVFANLSLRIKHIMFNYMLKRYPCVFKRICLVRSHFLLEWPHCFTYAVMWHSSSSLSKAKGHCKCPAVRLLCITCNLMLLKSYSFMFAHILLCPGNNWF